MGTIFIKTNNLILICEHLRVCRLGTAEIFCRDLWDTLLCPHSSVGWWWVIASSPTRLIAKFPKDALNLRTRVEFRYSFNILIYLVIITGGNISLSLSMFRFRFKKYDMPSYIFQKAVIILSKHKCSLNQYMSIKRLKSLWTRSLA